MGGQLDYDHRDEAELAELTGSGNDVDERSPVLQHKRGGAPTVSVFSIPGRSRAGSGKNVNGEA